MKIPVCLLLIPIVLSSCKKLHDYLPAAPQFSKVYGGSNTDAAKYITRSLDGGYVFAGNTTSNDGDVSYNNGALDAWVVKIDKVGNKQWQRTLGGSVVDYANAVIATLDGGYLVAGATTSNDGDVSGYHGGSGADVWLVKLDKYGSIQWQKTLGGTTEDIAVSIIATVDGNYMMLGKTESNDGDVSGNHSAHYDVWVVKLDKNGSIRWQKTYGGSGIDEAYSIAQTTEGGYIIAGSTDSKDGDVKGYYGRGDVWVLKLDAQGNIKWQKPLGGYNYDVAFSITTAADGGYVFAGSTGSNNGQVTGNHGKVDAWVVKLDTIGNIVWQKTIGGTMYDNALSIMGTWDGGYVFAGYTSSINGNVSGSHGIEYDDAWIVKLDSSGKMIWQKAWGGSQEDIAYSLVTSLNGGFVVAGFTQSNDGNISGNHGEGDAWVFTVPDR